jgi:TonB family protein
VRKKLDEHKPALQGCVDEALRRDPHLRLGRIHIATTIAPSGQVTSARIDRRAVDQAPLGACLRKATRKIAFPPFSGQPFDVDIPIVVSAGD